MKPAAAVQRIRTDPHSPAQYRVDGTVSNIPEFAEAFKCSKKAKVRYHIGSGVQGWVTDLGSVFFTVEPPSGGSLHILGIGGCVDIS